MNIVSTYPPGIAHFPNFNLPEVMHYLYLPVVMLDKGTRDMRLPKNLEAVVPLINITRTYANKHYTYIYVTARKGWASPDNPLNRPGWHCDGFGTDDLNFILWVGPSTRFIAGEFSVSEDHLLSLGQFEAIGKMCNSFDAMPERVLYALNTQMIHATPKLDKGCWRQFVKISMSNDKYNLENNSHNYLFDYKWEIANREDVRNDPSSAGKDST